MSERALPAPSKTRHYSPETEARQRKTKEIAPQWEVTDTRQPRLQVSHGGKSHAWTIWRTEAWTLVGRVFAVTLWINEAKVLARSHGSVVMVVTRLPAFSLA